jgi:hypothetical protein
MGARVWAIDADQGGSRDHRQRDPAVVERRHRDLEAVADLAEQRVVADLDGAPQPASLKGRVLYLGCSRCARHVQRRYAAQRGMLRL